MSRRIIVCLVIMFWSVCAPASQPGQPLDCSDWVFLVPGLRCSMYSVMNALPLDSPFLLKGSNMPADNTGRLYAVTDASAYCPLGGISLQRYDGHTVQVVAYVCQRHSELEGDIDRIYPRSAFCCPRGGPTEYPFGAVEVVTFDAVNGRLLIPVAVNCGPGGWAHCLNYPSVGGDGNHGGDLHWIAQIEGLATLYEISQSYTPTPGTLAFRVPVHPEGLPAADHFDTYWGNVADLPNFTAAHPMQCSYPSTPPAVGDYLTAADTSPCPTPGRANYIVTAVTSGSQRRYGRKLIAGVLSGRDPALLPSCP